MPEGPEIRRAADEIAAAIAGQVAEEVSSELELDRVLPKVMGIAVDVLGADGGFPGDKAVVIGCGPRRWRTFAPRFVSQ